MPLSRIEIEQTAKDQWVAFVEVGAWTARRETVRGHSFTEVMNGVEDAYRRMTPPPIPAEMVPMVQDANRQIVNAAKGHKPR